MIKGWNHPVYPCIGTTIGVVILGIWYWCTDQVIVQRCLGAKNLTHSRSAAIMTAFLKILPLFIFVVPGLIACALWKSEIQANPDNAYPLIVTRLPPKGLAGLMIAVLLAALMSSLSSVFNSCSTLITMDVYRKFKANASEKTLVLVGRLSTAALVIISIIWIPMIRFLSNQIYQYLQSIQAIVGAPICAVFSVGILWKRATGKAALATLITGSIIGLARFISNDILYNGMKIEDLGPFNILTGYAFLNYAVGMFAFCVVLMVIISVFTQKPAPEKTTDLTFSAKTISKDTEKSWFWIHLALSILVMSIIVGLWVHFA